MCALVAASYSGRTVALLTFGVAGSGLQFEDRGVRPLKGVPGEWRLFRACA